MSLDPIKSHLQHRDLVISLVNLPPDKVHVFAAILDVPTAVIKEAEQNHPFDFQRVKSDILYWVANNKRVTWEDIAIALEVRGVDEGNLADEIRSRHLLSM